MITYQELINQASIKTTTYRIPLDSNKFVINFDDYNLSTKFLTSLSINIPDEVKIEPSFKLNCNNVEIYSGPLNLGINLLPTP